MARQGKARQGKNRRSQAKPKESRRRMRRRTVTRLRENGRRAAMTNEAGLTGGPGAGRNGRRRERKSTIVAEGTRRPSVASTCCASRLHFTPLSSLPILSLPPFFLFFYLFPFLNSSCPTLPRKKKKHSEDRFDHFQSPGFSPRPLSFILLTNSRAAFYTCITFTAQAMKYAYYTFLTALCFTV